MPLAVGLCLIGLVALIVGAELITRGGAALSARLGAPPIVIGLTVVALGTSTPELAVGIQSAAQGNGAVALGNVAGANIINLLLVLGLSAVLRPIPLRLDTIRVELPIAILAAFVLIGMALDGRLTPRDGSVLLAGAAAYTALVVWLALGEGRSAKLQFHRRFTPAEAGDRRALRQGVWELALVIAGVAVILVGANWLVDGAVGLARLWRVSDSFIGVTIVALGTTSPELATNIVSILRKQRDIGLGTLLGSYAYNILLILGAAGLASRDGIPISRELLRLDLPVMAFAALATLPLFLTGGRLSRLEGGALVAGYGVFLTYLILTRT